jgi:DNA-binding SARP family transcriptional activator
LRWIENVNIVAPPICLGRSANEAQLPAARLRSAGGLLGDRWNDRPFAATVPPTERGARLEFGILGPLEARAGGEPVPLGGARQRAVLAVLLTHAGELVSADRLIDELWGDNPPGTAANVLQGYVSHLRKALGREAIATRDPGYVVELEHGQLDLHRFEAVVEEGRRALAGGDPERAAALLREGLALWRGPALADFAYEPFAQAEIARLEELRLVAVERRIEADLALGRHAEVAGELEALIAKHPLRERLRAQLMLALYRAGRQAEALEAYRVARAALVDGLGIDPSPALQDLERAILRQDPALAVEAGTLQPARPETPDESDTPAPERAILVVPDADSAFDPLLALAEPLARRPPREVIMARLVASADDLAEATRLVQARRDQLIARRIPARAAAFTSGDLGGDVVLLASEQPTDLVLIDAPDRLLVDGRVDGDLVAILADAPCDVGLLVTHGRFVLETGKPVMVPFGGAEHDWSAIELAAWISRSLDTSLRLLGTSGDPAAGRRDASRLLARASLMVQQVVGVATDPVLVPPGDRAVVEASVQACLLVVGLSPRWRQEGLGAARLAVARDARPPTLLVRRGLRPGGIAPRESVTRFTWTLSGRFGEG